MVKLHLQRINDHGGWGRCGQFPPVEKIDTQMFDIGGKKSTAGQQHTAIGGVKGMCDAGWLHPPSPDIRY